MPYTITVADVKDGFSTAASDAEINMFIVVVDEADDCFAANSVSEEKGKVLKIAAVRHILVLSVNSGGGAVRSQTAPSGASQSFGGWQQQGEGLAATSYGALVRQLDEFGCLTSILENNQNLVLWEVGP